MCTCIHNCFIHVPCSVASILIGFGDSAPGHKAQPPVKMFTVQHAFQKPPPFLHQKRVTSGVRGGGGGGGGVHPELILNLNRAIMRTNILKYPTSFNTHPLIAHALWAQNTNALWVQREMHKRAYILFTIQVHCFTKEHNNCFEVHCFTREQNNCFAIQVHCFAREHNNCFTKQCMCHNATINCTCGAFTLFMQFLWIVAAFTPSATLGPALMLPTSARTRYSNAPLPCRPLSPRACRANRIASASG